MRQLETAPSSLTEKVAELYPDQVVTSVTFQSLEGLLYDDPEPGPNGGNVRVFYFLKDRLFVQVGTEIFEVDEPRIKAMLDKIRLEDPIPLP